MIYTVLHAEGVVVFQEFYCIQCIAYVNSKGSAVYACTLDAEKAFDGILHSILLKKVPFISLKCWLLVNLIMHNFFPSLYVGFTIPIL